MRPHANDLVILRDVTQADRPWTTQRGSGVLVGRWLTYGDAKRSAEDVASAERVDLWDAVDGPLSRIASFRRAEQARALFRCPRAH